MGIFVFWGQKYTEIKPKYVLLHTKEHEDSGTQRFVSGNICSECLNGLRNSYLIAMKTTDFFGETAPQTFTIRGLLIPIVFGGKIWNLECKIRSASFSGEPSAARKFGGYDSVS